MSKPKKPKHSKLLSREESAQYVGISLTKLTEEKAAGRFPDYAMNSCFTRSQLDEYLQQLATFGHWDCQRHITAMESKYQAFCNQPA